MRGDRPLPLTATPSPARPARIAAALTLAGGCLLGSVARESLALMAGLWWDLGDAEAQRIARQARAKRAD